MRERSHKLRSPVALLYLLLGIAAAWHTPHDIRSNASPTILCANPHTPSVYADAFCALCSWQSIQQATASTANSAAAAAPLTAAPNLPTIDAPAPGFSLAHLARGPPSV